jgi:peptide-methionine (S)-S-oxide reductase
MNASTRIATLAGDCVWGLQTLARCLPGVICTRVGYVRGDVSGPTYRNRQAHIEAIEVVFDLQIVSFRALLELFFQTREPTKTNRQRNGLGAGYPCLILYAGDEQRKVAEEIIADGVISGRWPCGLVTEVVPATPFWEAKLEQQDYPKRLPTSCERHFLEPEARLPRQDDSRGSNQVRRIVKWSSEEIARFKD